MRCTPCSRRVERNIIKEYEIENAQYETQVQSLTRELRAEMDADSRREMRGKISELVEELGDLKDRRNEEIAEVRFRQGVGASCWDGAGWWMVVSEEMHFHIECG